MLCEFDCFGVGVGSGGCIIIPKVKLATVLTLDRLEKEMFRLCLGRVVSKYVNLVYNCLRW